MYFANTSCYSQNVEQGTWMWRMESCRFNCWWRSGLQIDIYICCLGSKLMLHFLRLFGYIASFWSGCSPFRLPQVSLRQCRCWQNPASLPSSKPDAGQAWKVPKQLWRKIVREEQFGWLALGWLDGTVLVHKCIFFTVCGVLIYMYVHKDIIWIRDQTGKGMKTLPVFMSCWTWKTYMSSFHDLHKCIITG